MRKFSSKAGGMMHNLSMIQPIHKFYKEVNVQEHSQTEEIKEKCKHFRKDPQNIHLDLERKLANLCYSDKFYSITLDGRELKTFYKENLFAPNYSLGCLLAQEWDNQGPDKVHLATMPIVRIYIYII